MSRQHQLAPSDIVLIETATGRQHVGHLAGPYYPVDQYRAAYGVTGLATPAAALAGLVAEGVTPDLSAETIADDRAPIVVAVWEDDGLRALP